MNPIWFDRGHQARSASRAGVAQNTALQADLSEVERSANTNNQKKFDYFYPALLTPETSFLPDLAPILAAYFALKKITQGLSPSL